MAGDCAGCAVSVRERGACLGLFVSLCAARRSRAFGRAGQFPFEGRTLHIRANMASREDNVYMAKLSEQAERYDEMVEAVRE